MGLSPLGFASSLASKSPNLSLLNLTLVNNDCILPSTTRTMGDRQGWTNPPDSRGTINIIWDSLLTMFLCCWSVLVVNVPDPGASSWQFLLRKIFLVLLCAIAPEILFQVALGQWLSAHHSVKLFHEAGYPDWTLRHGFYAGMGGFHLRPPNWKSFPIDVKQLHYLITRRYVQYPGLSDTHIRDKNRVDGILRFITLVQTLWFIINIISRASQGLAITALELGTSAFVMVSLATTLCWIRRPADVQSPDYISTITTITDILLDGGEEAAGVYYNTPLDFISRQEWSWSILWAHAWNCLRKLHLAAQPLERPVTRTPNTRVPVIKGSVLGIFLFVTVGYLGIFIAGWNFSFPTRRESILWRAASVTALSSALATFGCNQISFSWYPKLRRQLKLASQNEEATIAPSHPTTAGHGVKRRHRAISAFAMCLKNSCILKDPMLDAPIGAIIATWVLTYIYCAARVYITVADFMELRSLPRSAYQVVDWSMFWPHL